MEWLCGRGPPAITNSKNNSTYLLSLIEWWPPLPHSIKKRKEELLMKKEEGKSNSFLLFLNCERESNPWNEWIVKFISLACSLSFNQLYCGLWAQSAIAAFLSFQQFTNCFHFSNPFHWFTWREEKIKKEIKFDWGWNGLRQA